MKTALVILQYNNYNDTINCIRSVGEYNSADICYVIVDNNSSVSACASGMADYLRSGLSDDVQIVEDPSDSDCPLPRYTFLLNKENRGYASGNNAGLKIALSDPEVDSVLVLNNDILFVEDIIPQMREFLFHTDNCAVVSPFLYKRDGKTPDRSCARKDITPIRLILSNLLSFSRRLFAKIMDGQYLFIGGETESGQPLTIELPSGSCMLMSRDFIQKTNCFDENTFLYYEENILFRMAQRQGMVSYLLPSLKCIHLGGESTRSCNSVKLIRISRDSCMYYLNNYCSYSRAVVLLVALTWNARIGFLSLCKKIMRVFGR